MTLSPDEWLRVDKEDVGALELCLRANGLSDLQTYGEQLSDEEMREVAAKMVEYARSQTPFWN